MSKTRARVSLAEDQDMRPEYRFDYSKARPNRFASRMGRETVAVVLEPDVAAVFKTSDSVNELLRSVIAALPRPERRTQPKKTASR